MNVRGISKGRLCRMLVAASALSVASALAATPAFAQEATRRFNVPAQPMARAVLELGRQAGISISAPGEVTRGRTSQAVSGEMTTRAALGQMLEGSGLSFEFVNGSAVRIYNNNMGPPGAGEAQAAGAAANNESADGAGVSEILVVGSRSLNADIRRSEDDAQPYVVVSGAEIQRSGASNLEEYLRSRLPMNTAAGLSGQGNITNLSNSGQINLRGLGSTQTLILVDGRRVPGVSTGSALNQGSINGISITSIERVEILPATASGIYGGSATGGVVNIILRRNYNGVDFQATYGNTSQGDADSAEASINGGFALFEGRTRVSFGGSIGFQDGLSSHDRQILARRSRELLIGNNPTGFASPPLSSTINVCAIATTAAISCAATPLVLDAQFGNRPLGSNFTSVPVGYSGAASDNGTALVANGGTYNFDVPRDSFPLFQSSYNYSATLNVRQEITNSITAFVDYYRDRVENSLLTDTGVSFNLAANAATNPFQQNIRVTIPTGLPLANKREVETQRLRSGLIVRLPGGWAGSAEYGYATTASTQTSQSNQGPTAQGLSLLQAGGLSDPFNYGGARPSLFNVATLVFGPLRSRLQDASVRASGPIFTLPGGPVTVTGLAEWRREQLLDRFQEVTLPPAATEFSWAPDSFQTVRSGYAEIRLPFFSASQGRSLLRELELTASARYDDYSLRTVGQTFVVPSRNGPFPAVNYVSGNVSSLDYTFALRYSPAPGLVFRASYGTGFVPPGLDRLTPLVQDIPANAAAFAINTDPRRGGGPLTGGANGLITRVINGNPDLRPEQSTSLALGVVFEPSFVPGLRISADYVRIRKTDEITAPIIQFVIDNEADLPGRIVRGPNLPGDPAGFAGPIVFLDASALNIATTSVNAIDMQFDYALRTSTLGEWRFFALGTYLPDRRSQTLPTSGIIDSSGFRDGPLEFRGNFGVDWNLGRWAAGWNAQFYDSYRVCTSAIASSNATACATIERNQGSQRIPSEIYHDFYLSYRFNPDGRFLRGLELVARVQNAFDHVPATIAGTVPTYSLYGDPRLRRFLISIRTSLAR